MSSPTLVKQHKADIISRFGATPKDTGRPEVQVALLTHRINSLNTHFKKHKLDVHSKQGLLKLVGQRRRLLRYLKEKDTTRYTQLLKELKLRK